MKEPACCTLRPRKNLRYLRNTFYTHTGWVGKFTAFPVFASFVHEQAKYQPRFKRLTLYESALLFVFERVIAINMSLKTFINEAKNRLLKPSMWSGDFATWHNALENSIGYSSFEILNKVKTAIIKVKNGEAAYERDSVIFDKIEYSWPLLSSLMWIAAKNRGSVKILDIGGSLGTSYFQNRKFLDKLPNFEWNIVEQENFVSAGRDGVEDNNLRFFYTINECVNKQGSPDIAVLSASLPYFEKPYVFLNELLSYDIPHILVDNTFFNFEDRDRITVQKVSADIYPGSYPCWFLSYKKILQIISAKYQIISEHLNETKIYLDRNIVQYKGFLAMHQSDQNGEK